jgi:hypothetical protein
MLWGIYFFFNLGEFKFSLIIFTIASFFAFSPFVVLWMAKNTSYEIRSDGLVFITPFGQRGLWQYNCILSVRKITLSELQIERLKNILTKQYLTAGVLPASILPSWFNPTPMIVIDTSVSRLMGRKLTWVITPENQEHFLKELNDRLVTRKPE